MENTRLSGNGAFRPWKAVLDLGSNTFQMLVGKDSESGWEIGSRWQRFAGLGLKGLNRGILTEEAMKRGLAVLQTFQQEVHRWGIEPRDAQVLGTSALRQAKNAAVFTDRVKEETGFSIRIISGEEEARFIQAGVEGSGVLAGIPQGLVVDIGGGSVEFVVYDNFLAIWKTSLEIGGIRLLDRFRKQDPMDAESVGQMRTFLQGALEPVREKIAALPEKPVLVGSAGSFETLAEMASRRAGREFLPEQAFYRLSFPEFDDLARDLLALDLEGRKSLPGMSEIRASMIPAAVVLIQVLTPWLNTEEIRVSTWSLKEGCLWLNLP